ncbi:MAG: DUF3160 domain-containing protein [Candidatus Heimdallarchaeaceae archaeon]
MKISERGLKIIGFSVLGLVILSLAVSLPIVINQSNDTSWKGSNLIQGTAATHVIKTTVNNEFATYTPNIIEYTPSITPTQIMANLANVDMQGLKVSDNVKKLLETYGFALVNEEHKDIYEIYENDGKPKFITTDLCLHAYHVLYDISLRVLEGTYFFEDFQTMLETLRNEQLDLNSTVSEEVIHEALKRNIAYLSVMLYLLDNTTTIPSAVMDLTMAELDLINAGEPAVSAIFGYEEDYTQYKVRGHYTRNDLLKRYFKAMMYAGRIGFLLQGLNGEEEVGIKLTRMALLLISSFDTKVGEEDVWSYWDRVYQPTAFYVGTADDLTPREYYTIWQDINEPKGDELVDDNIIRSFIEKAKKYRKPQINSMFVNDAFDHENVTQGFRLMGQRFIPDSYIFQQLVHDKVAYRMFPQGLDVFSVFGSPRAAYYLQSDNKTYSDYSEQVLKLRKEFGNLTDYDWTQNLYWLWLYTLFPLLEPAGEGYPGFMQSDAWADKALMTASGSWAELRHDTILYAKQSYTLRAGIPELAKGYVEPYPEVYSRLASLVRMMQKGLEDRGLVIEDFSEKLSSIADIFDRLTEISIKELENKVLTQDDLIFINDVGEEISDIASYNDPEYDPWVSEADDRMAIVADVHTDTNSGKVLEVATGDPYTIYVIVQNQNGKLRLTIGGTYSYFEFKQPITERLSDEEWHEMLDNNPPELPFWIQNILPISSENSVMLMLLVNDKRK